MSLAPFQASAPLTLGVELELQLIDLTDLDLAPVANDLLHWLKRAPFPGEVKPEITAGMIEISTDPQPRYEPLLQQLLAIRDKLVDAAGHLNMGICGGGAHPFQHWAEQRIFPAPRFEKLSHLYGYLAKQFTIFGQHIHVGCRNADEALYLLHALNRYIPHFIALSASSPFLYGVDTQFDSARLNSISAFPLSGRAPFLLSWDQFANDYFNKMKHTGIVESMKDFYWDMRPKPEFGTLELRICDTPLTVQRAAQLAAYLQALCHLLLEHAHSPLDEDEDLVYNFNRFQACRFGLDATLVHPTTHQHLLLREDILSTLGALAPHAITLGSQDALSALREIAVSGNDAATLRAHYSKSGHCQAVALAALHHFRT